MRVGIVGSRTFPQLKLVEWFVRDLPGAVNVISGGAKGVDAYATECAKARGLPVRVHAPNLDGCKERHEYSQRYYERNQRIVDDCDLLVAFTEKDYGGTWDTIKRARVAGVPVKIIKPSAFFPGLDDVTQNASSVDSSNDSEPNDEQGTSPKGSGPFALKRISLGSYALRRKCYLSPEDWANFLVMKEHDAEGLAEIMLPHFVKFFSHNKRFGWLDALTMAPRSKRNLDRPHVMEILGHRLATDLSVPFFIAFEPSEKSTRGGFAKHGEICVTPDVSRYVNKVLWVLDDVTTTNKTLGASVQALTSLEIHAHGLAYLVV